MGINISLFNKKYRIAVHEVWDVETKEEAEKLFNELFNYKHRYGRLEDFDPNRNTVTVLSKNTEPERNSVTETHSKKM